MSTGIVFWPETAELIAHCVLGHGPDVESNHCPTVLVSFFKFCLSVLTKAQYTTSDSDWLSRTESVITFPLTSKKMIHIVLILDFDILAFLGLGESEVISIAVIAV
jgi:hypothetical protein